MKKKGKNREKGKKRRKERERKKKAEKYTKSDTSPSTSLGGPPILDCSLLWGQVRL